VPLARVDDQIVQQRRQQCAGKQADQHQPGDVHVGRRRSRPGDDLAHQRQVVDVPETDIQAAHLATRRWNGKF
jgi:hypothetical protein